MCSQALPLAWLVCLHVDRSQQIRGLLDEYQGVRPLCVTGAQDLSVRSCSGPNRRARKNAECESGKSLFIVIDVGGVPPRSRPASSHRPGFGAIPSGPPRYPHLPELVREREEPRNHVIGTEASGTNTSHRDLSSAP